MRPFTLFLFSLLSHLTLQAQSDTLYVNDTHNLVLIFPEPITRAVTGHPHYQFGYDKDTPERLGLLQGHAGADSNLLVLTEDGLAYSFALAYRERLQEGHRFVKVGESIGTVEPEKPLDSLFQNPMPSLGSDTPQYRKASAYFLERNRSALKSKRKDGIILSLRDMAYYGKETYIVMDIENRSDIDFEVDFVQVFKTHGNPRKKSSYQKLAMEPLYKYLTPGLVKVGQKQRFIYVLPKFTVGNSEKLVVELREKRGSRHIRLHWH
ncbi:DUF4138 domain-containing protein [Allomuricauda taeanensis]|uniref:DUF4138 domain-containing protein n=1 Tax=Flagellimonas taeanensis TaxID=1005926 RepID=UPI002E7BBDB8|nr:DUF4138 domain-containing protein [Allomuricauda taeanensis]MEE1963911.1 DUF4138 domain-containing protein [Allomuricauda taeanensis]